MGQDLKKLNIAFVFIFSFVGCVFIYISVCFALKMQKKYEFYQTEIVKDVVFSLKPAIGSAFIVMAEYKLASSKSRIEPLFVSAKLCRYESEELAQIMIDDFKKREWVAYINRAKESTLNKPITPIKELVYLLVCFSLLLYFYILRRQVVKLSGRV